MKDDARHTYQYVREGSLWTGIHWNKLINIPTFIALNPFGKECIWKFKVGELKELPIRIMKLFSLRNAELRNSGKDMRAQKISEKCEVVDFLLKKGNILCNHKGKILI